MSNPTPPIPGPHDLRPIPDYNPQTPCSVCHLKSSGTMFACVTCGSSTTSLHQSCAEYHQACAKLPETLVHASHRGCTLSLTYPTYPGGSFVCNGCSEPGKDKGYHCPRCNYDLHAVCAAQPLVIMHQAHASCELSLAFSGPSPNHNGFKCDVCGQAGSNQWRYRCNSCDFDVHMNCARLYRLISR